MSKFCENCGAEMDDNDTVCKYCGPTAEESNTTANETVTENTTVNNSTSTAKKMDTKNMAIIGGIIAAIIIVLIILFSTFGKGWEKPIKNYFKGMEKAKAETYLKAYPEFMDMSDKIDDEDLEDRLDNLEDEYGEKIKISYKIAKKEKIKKSELDDVTEYIKKTYEEDVKVSKGYEVKVKATIKGKDDDETDTQKLYVYKIDGKWCYFPVSPETAKKNL